ncbi:MarR family transcriptional regulator, partial [Streptomyces sp. NPDC002039]|uniref:MarR family transcriptional regulator n=1 Tax=Streptomyces sp. NPDC002039 TaxID=3154660 RepID=UPI0033247A62
AEATGFCRVTVVAPDSRIDVALPEDIAVADVPPFAAAGLGDGDFDVLAALRRSGKPYALSAGELSRTVLVTTGAITKRVDRLETRGLVNRSVTESDSRGRVIALTAEGVELTDQLIATHLANQHLLLAGLGGEEQAQLADLLERLTSTLAAGEA